MGTEGRYSHTYEECLWGFGDRCVISLALGKEGHNLASNVGYKAIPNSRSPSDIC